MIAGFAETIIPASRWCCSPVFAFPTLSIFVCHSLPQPLLCPKHFFILIDFRESSIPGHRIPDSRSQALGCLPRPRCPAGPPSPPHRWAGCPAAGATPDGGAAMAPAPRWALLLCAVWWVAAAALPNATRPGRPLGGLLRCRRSPRPGLQRTLARTFRHVGCNQAWIVWPAGMALRLAQGVPYFGSKIFRKYSFRFLRDFQEGFLLLYFAVRFKLLRF